MKTKEEQFLKTSLVKREWMRETTELEDEFGPEILSALLETISDFAAQSVREYKEKLKIELALYHSTIKDKTPTRIYLEVIEKIDSTH